MCGIAGAIDADAHRGAARVAALNERQRHRGPDHAALERAGSFTLGNTRLAVQDPTPVGNQPFRSSDGRYVCVFNGEIYNYRELIRDHDLVLPSHCDGAVIPELWARLGQGCLRLFRGMYAIALVDTVEDNLTICRDPFGIKPLYYRRLDDGTTLFGSEVRPLAASGPAAAVSALALAAYLHLGAVPADRSPFEGIEAVPPNTVVRFSADGTARASWIVGGLHPLTEASAGDDVGSVGETFLRSVDLHLRSDVPSALLLSSGVDSSAIASAARTLGRTLHCLTVAGAGTDDEVDGAARTAATYQHDHQIVSAGVDATDIDAFFRAMQRPTVDGLNNFIVCRAVQSAGYRVALSGLGGDEALGGYPHYQLLPWLGPLHVFDRFPERAWRAVAPAMRSRRRQKLWQLAHPAGPRTSIALDLLQRQLLPRATVRALTGTDPAPVEADGQASRSFQSLVEAELRHYLQPMLLMDADAFSMCSSVELRVPFVDRPLVAAAVSPRSAARRAPGKRLLADALGDDYLRALVDQRKRGFTVPVRDWLKSGPLRGRFEELAVSSAPVWDFVDRSVALALLDETEADRWQDRWALTALNGWLSSLAEDRQARPAI